VVPPAWVVWAAWNTKHRKYIDQDWITKPTIFATVAIKYFPKTGSLLELGSGQGQDSKYFTELGYKVLATDFSDYALSKIPNIKTQVVDLSLPLPFSSNSFDIVYSHLALHYFDKKRTQELFDEIFNFLKPGGIFATLTNTIEDREISTGTKIEDEYYQIGDIQKRFFSIDSMRKFTSKFETLLLDNHGETHKDEIKTLIRYIGKKHE